MTKEQIYTFLHSKEHAVISTASLEGKPEAALVGFGETKSLELIMGTSNKSRKYLNMKQNPRVALVIGWEEDSITVQYEGIARELEGEEIDKYVDMYVTKVPSAAKYRIKPNQTYFLISPTWIRYSDLGNGDHIDEFKF